LTTPRKGRSERVGSSGTVTDLKLTRPRTVGNERRDNAPPTSGRRGIVCPSGVVIAGTLFFPGTSSLKPRTPPSRSPARRPPLRRLPPHPPPLPLGAPSQNTNELRVLHGVAEALRPDGGVRQIASALAILSTVLEKNGSLSPPRHRVNLIHSVPAVTRESQGWAVPARRTGLEDLGDILDMSLKRGMLPFALDEMSDLPKCAVNSALQPGVQLTSVAESGGTEANRHIDDVAPTFRDVNGSQTVSIAQRFGERVLDAPRDIVRHYHLG
jgi:hypothetical protein